MTYRGYDFIAKYEIKMFISYFYVLVLFHIFNHRHRHLVSDHIHHI